VKEGDLVRARGPIQSDCGRDHSARHSDIKGIIIETLSSTPDWQRDEVPDPLRYWVKVLWSDGLTSIEDQRNINGIGYETG